jgi:hypothetical protein
MASGQHSSSCGIWSVADRAFGPCGLLVSAVHADTQATGTHPREMDSARAKSHNREGNFLLPFTEIRGTNIRDSIKNTDGVDQFNGSFFPTLDITGQPFSVLPS